MESKPMSIPEAWNEKIERDAEAAARLQFHPIHSTDQNTACRITYRNGAMAYAPWLYTCQMNYAALRAKCEKMEQALKEFSESNCDYEDVNFKSLHSTECRSCHAKQLLQSLEQEGEKEPTIPHPEPFNHELLNVISGAENSKEEDLRKVKEAIAELPTIPQQGAVTTVFVPCAEDDPRSCGAYQSHCGRSLAYVRESRVPVVESGAVWVTGQYDRLYDQLKAEPERKVVCWVDYSWNFKDANPTKFRDICTVRGEKLEFVSRGHGYGGADMMIGWDDEKKYFLEECERLYVQWLDEGGEKEVNNG